ncbi:MAG: Gfo/Idh/MocA family oxidoreductase [Planctomycetes bacterium]|nr:Gfo/Idh/MocA family oxidoreductase [Planctomycetota bacterium]
MKKYRVAIVGLGRMAHTIDQEVVGYPAVTLPYSIAASVKEIERLELAAGADIDAAKRQVFGERWGVKALYADYLEMIEKEKPDLVAICTRAELHAEMAVRTAEAGVKMIYLEKAMACSMREADQVLEACQKRKVSFNTGVLRRFDPRYQWARKLIERGEIGQPRAAVQYGASSLMHGHIHAVDTLMYMLGDPRAESVCGELRPRTLRIEDNRLDKDPAAVYHIQFQGGLEAWTLPVGNWDFEVFGAGGVIRGANNGMDWALRKPQPMGKKWSATREVPFPPCQPRSSTVVLLEDIVDAFEQGRPTLGNVEVTHHATEICLAVAESHRQGGVRVNLPIANRDLYVWHV